MRRDRCGAGEPSGRRRPPLAAIVAALVALLVVATGTAWARVPIAGAAAQTAPTLRLITQSAVVLPEGTIDLTIDLRGDVPADAELVVDVHGALSDDARNELERARTGDIVTRSIQPTFARTLAMLPLNGNRVQLSIPTVVRTRDARNGEIPLTRSGIYPVRVELRSGGQAVAGFTTFVVRSEDGDPAPPSAAVAVVLSAGGAPGLQPDGHYAVDNADRARLQTITDVLGSTTAPASVDVEPELLDALGQTHSTGDAALRSSFAATLSGRQVLDRPYVRLDAASATHSQLTPEFTRLLSLGEQTLADTLGPTGVDRSTWVADAHLDTTTLASLRALGVRQVVVPEGGLGSGPPPVQPVAIAAGDDALAVPVAVADKALGQALGDGGDDPVLRGYQILAELTAIAISHPDVATRGRGIVLAPDRSVPLDRTVVGTVLSGLTTNPYLHAATLDDWFRTVPRAAAPEPGTPAPALTPTPAPDMTDYATGLGLTRLSLASLASMLRPDNPMPDDLERYLRVASSSDLAPAQRQAYLDVVNGRLNDLRDPIDDIPKRKITLAGRSSEIPLTLHRRLPYPVTVIVRLSSSKLRFPKGDLVVRLDDETVQQRVPVEARANGTFPLEVEILTPAGDELPEARATLTVQATALSGFGAVITGGGLLVLVVWWARHLRRRRRERIARHHPSYGVTGRGGNRTTPVGAHDTPVPNARAAPAPPPARVAPATPASSNRELPSVPGFLPPGDRSREVNGH